MKKFNYIKGSLLLMMSVLTLYSCKKNDNVVVKDVVFTVNVNSYDVTFTNTTTDSKSFKWEFGDGTTSTEQSPSHTYTSKGKFVATLSAVLTNGKTISGSTIINVSKSSPIKLNDNTLADWDTISNVIVSTSKGGIVQKAKFDYDSQNVYIYMEIKTTVAAGNIFDFYLDTDNSSATGLLTSDIPGGGYDYLLEGPLLSQAGGLVQYQHTGGQNAFSFNPLDIPEYYKLGTITETNGVLKFEMALVRGKIGGLTGKALTFGIIVSDANYNPLGSMPDAGLSAITLNISQ
ncbi:MAG: hypothetical protein JWP37_2967 [Mucilaginibacter sp.]|nr:hypothetical protein [Mucilaginibacter sp.]